LSRGAEVYASQRLLKAEGDASLDLVGLAHQEAALLIRRRGSDVAWISRYDTIAGFRGPRLIEMDLGGGHRMIAYPGDGGEVTFLGMGPHGWFTRYTPDMLATDLRSRVLLPARFRPGVGAVLGGRGSSNLVPYANETQPEWLYFLDDEQAGIADSIQATIEEALLTGEPSAHFLIGGPGTGKTTILLQLLARLSGLSYDSPETWDVRMQVADELAAYITASTGWDLTAARRPPSAAEPADVLLVDDPASIAALRDVSTTLGSGLARSAVVGFDPLQLRDSLDDIHYARIRDGVNAHEWTLSTCYRQKEHVGATLARVASAVARSSPFLVEERQRAHAAQRARVTELSNSLVFVNPSGYVLIEESSDFAAWRKHFRWIGSQRLWQHWTPVLVVVDDDVEIPQSWRDLAARSAATRWTRLRDAAQVKGMEYQHVVLVLTDDRYRAVQDGFTGSGRPMYNEYRLLRIPFSRAKDSVAVFVAADGAAE